MKTNAPNLEKALRSFLSESAVIGGVASILEFASLKGTIYYEEAWDIAGEDPEEPLLAAEEWRLLLPVRTMKSMAWEDRLFMPMDRELFEMPNIILRLVKDALTSAQWRTTEAIGGIFREMGDPAWQTIPEMVAAMAALASSNTVSANQITRVCLAFGFSNKTDWLIAELKGAGVISPRLSSPADVMRAGSPLYEMNPSITCGIHPH
jgi:hypothetical protein